MTMQRTMKFYQLPEIPKTAGPQPMGKKDIPIVHQLLTWYLKQFHLMPVRSQEEVNIGSTPRRISPTLLWWRRQTVR